MRWGGDLNPKLSKLLVLVDATLLEALQVLEAGAQSIAFVCDADQKVIGSLTDGDARRAILAGASLDSRCLAESMQRNFAFARRETDRAAVLDLMRARDIGQLPLLDDNGRLCGLHTVGQMISPGERANWAVLLAGGRGTRLAPMTETIPKPMLPVAGRPILERLILHLMSQGIRNFYVSISYLGHVVEEHFGDGSSLGCRIEYLRESVPLGTGGCLALIPEPLDDPLIVVNGDLVTQCDVGQLLDFHADGGFAATLGVRPHAVEVPYGVVHACDGRLVGLAEKPSYQILINAGVYVISPDTIKLVPRNEEHPITDLFESCLQHGFPVGVFTLEQEWVDVGRHEDLRRARGDQ
ncbi:MAG: nucleotidyltransferase family protein [Gemmatimonadaceae bacterium]